jgi:hypothetical protein
MSREYLIDKYPQLYYQLLDEGVRLFIRDQRRMKERKRAEREAKRVVSH